MISLLVSIGVIAGVGIVLPLAASSVKADTYGSKLEDYIISKNPQDSSDIERLTREYDLSASKRFL